MASSAFYEIFTKYRKFVEANVEIVGRVESATRIFSYLAPGDVISLFLHLILNQADHNFS